MSPTLTDDWFLPAVPALFLCPGESLLDLTAFDVKGDFCCFAGVSFDVCIYEDKIYISNLQ